MKRVWFENHYTTKNYKLLDALESLLQNRDFDVELFSHSYIPDIDRLENLDGAFEIVDHGSRELLASKDIDTDKWKLEEPQL